MSQLKYINSSIIYKGTIVRSQLKNIMETLEFTDIICSLLPLISLALWLLSLRSIDVRQMNDLGLVSVMSPITIIALCILLVSFALALQQTRMRTPLITLHLCLLIFMLYGITTLVEEEPRFSTVYRHAGYTEYILRTGSVNPDLDTYFSWPGFFILSGLMTRLAGYHDVFPIIMWTPVFFNLIYAGPLYMIFTSITSDKRLVWLGLWFFYLTNWIGQDYFSPQGLNFFMYLTIIAILLRWYKVKPKMRSDLLLQSQQSTSKQQLDADFYEQPTSREDRLYATSGIQKKNIQLSQYITNFLQKSWKWLTAPDIILHKPANRQQEIALIAILIIIFAFVVYSHPLTPFFTIASIAALVIFRRCSPFWLPILMTAMTAAWIFFMAQPFLAGHASMVTGTIGHIDDAISTNVTSRTVQGNAEHDFITRLRITSTLITWGLAFVGILYRMLKRQHNRYVNYRCTKSGKIESDLTYILLATVPFPLLFIQSYGGEMLLRIYLFILPMIAFFIASIFYLTTLHGKTYKTSIAIIIMSFILLSSFLFTRYGNENMDYRTHDEVNSIRYLYKIAPRGSAFFQAWQDAPWMFQDYEKYGYYSLSIDGPDIVIHTDVNAIIQFIKSKKSPNTYILFTRSEKVASESYSGLPKDTLKRLEIALIKSGQFKLIYSNHDAQIFIYSANSTQCATCNLHRDGHHHAMERRPGPPQSQAPANRLKSPLRRTRELQARSETLAQGVI